MLFNDPADTNPFPGLRPFNTHENHLFFGRDGQSDELLQRLRQRRFIAVVGTSGSGKSSLVRAGLLPSLHGGFMISAGSSWRVTVLRPGGNPIGHLAEALNREDVLGTPDGDQAIQRAIIEASLRRSGLGLADVVTQARMPAHENLLIVVDQFEEIFRFKNMAGARRSEDDAAAFVKLLLEATRQRAVPIYVIITMRSDFLGDCAQFRDLPEAINEGQYLIPRMTRDQRREAITGPVAVGRAEITAPLVNRLLNDAGDNPDQLPLLQHALMRMWHEWAAGDVNTPIDLPHYESIGGMAEALSRHADEAYSGLSTERSKNIAEKLFKLLTERGPDNREIRRPTRLEEICAVAEAEESEVRAVIECFRREGRSFLMPPPNIELRPDSLIDIAHESLIRGWQRLQRWVDDESLSARIYRRLAETAALYRAGEAGLWRDPDLAIAIAWRDKNRPNTAWGERYSPDFASTMKFLDESERARDAERSEREHQRRKTLRLTQALATVLLLGLLVSMALGFVAYQQRNEALARTRQAEESARRATQAEAETRKEKERAEENARQATQAKEEALVLGEIARRKADEASAALLVAKKAKIEAQHSALLAQQKEREARDAQQRAEEKEKAAKESELRARNLALRLRHSNIQSNASIFNLADKILQTVPAQERADWLIVKGRALAMMRNHDLAIAQFTEALENDPRNFPALAVRSYEYLLSKQPQKALQDANAALEIDQNDAMTYLNKAIGQGSLGLYGDAREAISESISKFTHRGYDEYVEYEVAPEIQRVTGQKSIYAGSAEALTALYYERANLAAMEGNKDFISLLEAATQRPGSDDAYLFALNWSWISYAARPQDYGALVAQGALWQRARNNSEAGRAYMKFKCQHERRRDPRYNDLMNWTAQRLNELHLVGAGCQVTEPQQEAPEAHVLLLDAIEASLSGRADSERLLNKAVRVAQFNPDHAAQFNPDSMIERARYRYRLGYFNEARSDCDEIIQHAPQTAIAYIYRALANSQLDASGEKIRSDVQEAKRRNPVAVPAANELHQGLEKISDKLAKTSLSEAIDFLERVAKYNLPSARPYYIMAKLFNAKGQYADALKAIKVAIAIKGDQLEFYDERERAEDGQRRSENAPGNEATASRVFEVLRSKALGFSEAGDMMSKSGRAGEALIAYGESLKVLDELARQKNAEDVRCEVETNVGKIYSVIIQQGSKEDVAAATQALLGDLKNINAIMQNELKRLSSTH